jgi:hypothetical protein
MGKVQTNFSCCTQAICFHLQVPKNANKVPKNVKGNALLSNPPLTNPRNLKLPSQQTLLGPQDRRCSRSCPGVFRRNKAKDYGYVFAKGIKLGCFKIRSWIWIRKVIFPPYFTDFEVTIFLTPSEFPRFPIMTTLSGDIRRSEMVRERRLPLSKCRIYIQGGISMVLRRNRFDV